MDEISTTFDTTHFDRTRELDCDSLDCDDELIDFCQYPRCL